MTEQSLQGGLQPFSASYAVARNRFLEAARARADHLHSFVIDAPGSQDEVLALDAALIRPANERALLVVTSGTHGVEGFCGSGCQLALLGDDGLLAQAQQAQVALLLVHALNPYGFSWQSRTNEHNIDLNRNARAFDAPPPPNEGYAQLHPHLVPDHWPPSAEHRQALAAFIDTHGFPAYQEAVSRGQYTHPQGVFFGGTARSASLRHFKSLLESHGPNYSDIGWIDIHTGLGPWGHAEKIFAGRNDPQEIERARHWWGMDVAVPFAGTSASVAITGQVASLIYEACPRARPTCMALEFGTVTLDAMFEAVRGEAWLRSHPSASTEQAERIRKGMRDAFFSGSPVWQGMVLGQFRTSFVQALQGLRHSTP